ncbi:nicotinate-nucleotide adenylyltransferase [Synechococcus sp. H60.3]|uniref:nicotinate-nucleotide adenylyltransferase n=1 Tax=unclassified Synechococcus TaxID=2626047 RepID=UPI0039C088C1
MSGSAPKQRRVGILGGTFNPVHHGHLIMAEQALWQFNLDQVLWMPAGDPPHKPLAAGASKADRLAMVKLAIADHERFACSELEIRRPGPSYTIETLRCLMQEQPNTQWYWIIGVDALRDLPQWYQAEELARLCHWIVAPRLDAGDAAQVLQSVAEKLPIRATILDAPTLTLSSTYLRQQIQKGGSIRYLVPSAVEHYIRQHRLYLDP